LDFGAVPLTGNLRIRVMFVRVHYRSPVHILIFLFKDYNIKLKGMTIGMDNILEKDNQVLNRHEV
jgi:hypothetical protein